MHGFLFAAIARALGDRGPAYGGRLTINPAPHFDLLGFLCAILFKFSWIRPIVLDHTSLRGGRLGLVVCVIGSLAVVLIASELFLLLRLPIAIFGSDIVAQTATTFLNQCSQTALWFVALNIVPIPPLTGAHFLTAAAPSLEKLQQKLYWPGVVLLVVLMVPGYLATALGPLHDWLSSLSIY